jgi:hypothetical protein
VAPGRCAEARLLFEFALGGQLRLLCHAVMQVKRASWHLKEQLPHWGAELTNEEHLARRRHPSVTRRINGEDGNSAWVTNDVPHMLIATRALHRCASPLHVRRLHDQVRSDDDLVEFARL